MSSSNHGNLTIETGEKRTDAENEARDKDRGWAWVVAFATMMNICLGVGMYRTLGMFVLDVMEVYETSVARVSVIFISVAAGFCVSAVAFIFGIGEIFHERALLTASGLVACAGFMVTYFSTRVEHLLAQGFCLGVSMQIGNSCGLEMVGKYFDRRRSAANGLAMSGVSLGVIVFPPIHQWLLDEFTYKGAALIVAAMSLNSIVCGALMRPIEFQRINEGVPEGQSETLNTTAASKRNFSGSRRGTEGYIDGVSIELETVPKSKKSISQSQELQPKARVSTSTNIAYSNAAYVWEMEMESPSTGEASPSASVIVRNIRRNRSLLRRVKDALRAFVLKAPQHRLTDSSQVSKHMSGCALFKSPLLALVQMFMFLSTTGSECMLHFLPAATHEDGMSDYQTAFLLSIVGVGDLLSRLGLGALGDCKLMKPYKMVIVSMFVLGTTCSLSRFASEFYSQVIFAVVVGLTYGIPYAYHGVLLLDFFGLQNLSRLLGLSNFVCGVSLASGSPFVGLLRDSFGSFDVPFLVIGALQIGGGLSLMAGGLLRWCQNKKRDSYTVS